MGKKEDFEGIMKIAVCSVQVPFVKGGAEYLCDNLYSELIKRHYEVEYIKIPFKWYPPQELINNALMWRLLDLTESDGKKIDGVITTKFPSYVIKHPKKITWLFHQHRPVYDLAYTDYDDLAPHHALGDIIRKKITAIDNKSLKESRKIFTISQNVTNRLDKYNHIPSEVLYPPPPFAGRYYCKNFDNYILYPSRLDPKKRQDLVIKSLKYVDDNIELKIVGTGPYCNFLRKTAKENGVENRVEFLGFVPENELLDLYANALCIPYTPFDEDLGYVSMESILSKKPLITCTDSGGSLEFIENGVTGFIVQPTPLDIAEAINKIYIEGSARKMGEQGHKKFGNKLLTWDSVIAKLMDAIS
jgi:glycosyltransferase involved in cell wall biosynthesis